MPPGALGEWRCTYAHGPASDGPQESGIPFAGPARGRSHPVAAVPAQKWPSEVFRARKLRGTCSPTWNGIGSGKALTLNPPHRWSSSHLRGILLPERSNLFQSHWSNQWLTNFSYTPRSPRHRLPFALLPDLACLLSTRHRLSPLAWPASGGDNSSFRAHSQQIGRAHV